MKKSIAQLQADYYGNLFEKHGPGVYAVASGQQVYKDLRYEKLSRLFCGDDLFSIHDVGFGIGHYYEYLKSRFPEKNIIYSGSEVTPQFVDYCRSVYPESSFHLRNLEDGFFPEKYDYLVFGGTFYHLSGTTEADFSDFVKRLLKNGFLSSEKGIAFNLITEFVEYRKEDLFYANLADMLNFIVTDLSRYFTVDHASPLYEYTVCVYTEQYISKRYTDEAFHKYYRNRSTRAG